MSYSLFLIMFICIPLAALIYLLRGSIRRVHWLMLLIMVTIAIIYTTPWENYVVATRIWYYDPKLVLNITLGFVPLEEYLFFMLQTLITGLFVFWLWRGFYPIDFAEKSGLAGAEKPKRKRDSARSRRSRRIAKER